MINSGAISLLQMQSRNEDKFKKPTLPIPKAKPPGVADSHAGPCKWQMGRQVRGFDFRSTAIEYYDNKQN